MFWIIIGLIEANAWELAYKEINKFHPSEPMYLLAIVMGAIIAMEFRAADGADRSWLQKILKRITARMGPELRSQFFERYQAEVIEIQRGRIVVPPAAANYGRLTGELDERAYEEPNGQLMLPSIIPTE